MGLSHLLTQETSDRIQATYHPVYPHGLYCAQQLWAGGGPKDEKLKLRLSQLAMLKTYPGHLRANARTEVPILSARSLNTEQQLHQPSGWALLWVWGSNMPDSWHWMVDCPGSPGGLDQPNPSFPALKMPKKTYNAPVHRCCHLLWGDLGNTGCHGWLNSIASFCFDLLF